MFFKAGPVVKYLSHNTNEFANFVPAKSLIPKWFKDIEKFSSEFPPKNATRLQVSVKGCPPFLDALTTGYLITTSYDLIVNQDNGPEITWKNGGEIIAVRDVEKENEKIPVPSGFSSVPFVWKFPIYLKAPIGYSLLLTHPLNRPELPFFTFSGIIEGGYVMPASGNLPFFIRADFEGVIPQGTPIAQIVPLKQESWKAEKDPKIEDIGLLNAQKAKSVLYGWYKKNIWNKKSYD